MKVGTLSNKVALQPPSGDLLLRCLLIVYSRIPLSTLTGWLSWPSSRLPLPARPPPLPPPWPPGAGPAPGTCTLPPGATGSSGTSRAWPEKERCIVQGKVPTHIVTTTVCTNAHLEILPLYNNDAMQIPFLSFFTLLPKK